MNPGFPDEKMIMEYRARTLRGFLAFSISVVSFLSGALAYAACPSGTNIRSWVGTGSNGGGTVWSDGNNWLPSSAPTTSARTAQITNLGSSPKSDSNQTVGCVDIQSGTLNVTNGVTLTIASDEFKNPYTGGLNVAVGSTWHLSMAGTAAQTINNVDTINYLDISNSTSVTFSKPMEIRNTVNITSSGTVIYVNANLLLDSALTIPATVTVKVASGATLTLAGGATVNGTLHIDAGGSVKMGNATTLTVNSGGLLKILGASGNVATLDADPGNSYNVSIAGSLNASSFRISRLTAAGLNLTGTAIALDSGEFHYLASGGYAVTLGAAASVPATLSTLGFYDDSAFGNVRNFNATSYNVANITVNNWSGQGGAANETDPNNRIAWGSAAGTQLTLTNSTASGTPPTTVNTNTGPTYFATFAFALTQAGTATNITSAVITQYGTASASDVDYIQVFKDSAGGTSCVYDANGANKDIQVGANLTLSGSPPTATVTFASGDVTTSGLTPGCFHVLAHISSNGVGGNTVGFRIAGTSDVVNSQGYSFASTSGPPVSAGTSTINGTPYNWNGATDTVWTTASNWSSNAVPGSANDCTVGVGTSVATLQGASSCKNTTLTTGGSLNFNSRNLSVYGSLNIQSGYTITNATASTITMIGAVNQDLKIQTTFPGNLTINPSVGSVVVGVSANSTVTGNLTITTGTLQVQNGANLTVGGNVTVASGSTLEVQAGGTLTMASGKTITVNSGGTLKLLGTSSSTATITSNATNAPYAIIMNGTITAQYYTLSRLGTVGANKGLNIASGATITGPYYLQNGTFTYPVSSNFELLTLNQQVPGNTMDNMTFDAGGSSATGVTNIKTVAAAGTLSIPNYLGSWSGASYENAPTYLISWGTQTQTITLNQDATGTAGPYGQGSTYNVGRFGFKQTLSGAYNDANITSLKLTLTGTNTPNDISQARIYYSSACTNSGGTLLGSGTFSGSPGTLTFSGLSGALIPQSGTPKRCIYVEFDIATGAAIGNTIGVEIAANSDVVNDQSYTLTGALLTLGSPQTITGTTTTWTGATSTDWCTAGNWTSGLPTSSLNASIDNAANDPIISNTCAAVAKSVTIGSGILVMNAGSNLDVYGNFSNTGTFTQSTGTITVRDTGSSSTQTLSNTGGSFGTITFNKTLGGIANVSTSTVTIDTLTFPAGQNFTWQVTNNQNMTLTNGVSIPSGITFLIDGGGTVKIPNTKGITVAGGTFKTNGTNDAYPQATTNKGKVTISGAGTWSFSATSGTVDLTGFIFDYIDTNGLNLSGTTSVTNLNGGQFTNLSNTYASVKAIQFNNSGTIPATATNVGWNWGANNTPPATTDAYLLASSTGCANHSINFDQWFGDFFVNVGIPDTTTKVSATSCTITISASASPVSMMSFGATGYDAAVSVNWVTGSELDHAGFNVYRSTQPASGFIQVNPSLIRNALTVGAGHGSYRYVDNDVANDQTYYYKIEDVATNGARELHGPVSATPRSGAGSVPNADSSTNVGGSLPGAGTGNAPSSGTIATPGLVDLGNGVHILAQSRRSLRLEIIPPAPSFSPSSWNATYETISIPGYSAILEAGKPEVLERTVLVEVDSDLSTVSVGGSSVQETTASSHRLQPAPSWSMNGAGQLVPSYNPDAAAYSLNSFVPSVPADVSASTVRAGGKNYVKITVRPVHYNAALEQLKISTKIVLDLGLEGSAWSTPTPSSAGGFYVPENALKIKYSATGFYKLSYEDLVAAGVDGPFAGADTSRFRMYYRGNETPIEISSANGYFGPGDVIRFYALYNRSISDSQNEMILTRDGLYSTEGTVRRIEAVNGDPTGYPYTDEIGTRAQARAEVDAYPLFDLPVGDGLDHLYWARLYKLDGQPADANSSLDMPITLPRLISAALDPVRVHVFVKGGAYLSQNALHHVALYVNHGGFAVGDQAFAGTDIQELIFEVPSSYFVAGLNTVTLAVLGDLIPSGDGDLVYVDRIEVDYRSDRVASAGLLEVFNYRRDYALTVRGFVNPAALKIYDVTDPTRVRSVVFPTPVSLDGGVTYQVTFAGSSGPDYDLGFHYFAVQTDSLPVPPAVELARGYRNTLRSVSNGADLIVIGSQELISSASELIAARSAQGLRAVAVSSEQIFEEFSYGTRSPQALRNFISYALSNWVAPAPKFILLLGDSSYDPNNRLGLGSSDPRLGNSLPMAIQAGTYLDFGSDSWIAASEVSKLPQIAVGRIPTNDPGVLSQYIRKLLDYESGSRAPQGAQAKKLSFISDADHMSEHFASNSDSLATGAMLSRSTFSTARVDKTALGSGPALKSAIVDTFNLAPLVINYLGHGAEDRWSGADVFLNSDASSLSNSALPIVMSLSCLNSYYYDADPNYKSLGENLIFNSSGGAIAFIGSTTMTVPSAQLAFARAFYDELGKATRQSSQAAYIGDLFVRAKVAMGDSAASRDAIQSYMLMGDPSMPLPAAAYDPAPAASAQAEEKGGFLSCGTVSTAGKGGSGSGPAAVEAGFLLLMIACARLLLLRKSREKAKISA